MTKRYFPVLRLQVGDEEGDFFSEKEVDRYGKLLKKFGILDAIGQVSYWDDSTLVAESHRWFTTAGINKILKALKRTIFSDSIYFEIYEEDPKGYPKLVEKDRLTDIVLPILEG